jgi:hypothetical protein
MGSYIIHDTQLRHDGGVHNLEVEVDGEQAVIRFGASFTLRLDEKSIDQLRDILYDTSREITVQRYDRRHTERLAEIEAEEISDEDLVAASEFLRSAQQNVDLWDLPEEDDVTGHPV